MKHFTLHIIVVTLLFSCSSIESTEEILDSIKNIESEETSIVYPLEMLENYSDINKNTSWYKTNISFVHPYDFISNGYRGFEKFEDGSLRPFMEGTYRNDKEECCYYWHDLGQYLYTDLDNDGLKDLWAYYGKAPWPKDANGLFLYIDNANNPQYDLQVGLTQVRKQVLSDFNNDGLNEIMLFSSGYDAYPFPGDSLAFFTFQNKKYSYLADDIGYFHGGATGDVDLDGYQDIIAYSGGSAIIQTHPVFYQNLGDLKFELKNEIFKNFTENSNFYTVELFDIDNDGLLDLFLGGGVDGGAALIAIKNENGIFDLNKGINFQTNPGLGELALDIDFFDFDEDGINEILVINTKDSYAGCSLKLYKFSFEGSEEITSEYFDKTEFNGSNTWIKWLHIVDVDNDGDLDVAGDGLFGSLLNSRIFWKNVNGKFISSQ